jgi:hypothetical protein
VISSIQHQQFVHFHFGLFARSEGVPNPGLHPLADP